MDCSNGIVVIKVANGLGNINVIRRNFKKNLLSLILPNFKSLISYAQFGIFLAVSSYPALQPASIDVKYFKFKIRDKGTILLISLSKLCYPINIMCSEKLGQLVVETADCHFLYFFIYSLQDRIANSIDKLTTVSRHSYYSKNSKPKDL